MDRGYRHARDPLQATGERAPPQWGPMRVGLDDSPDQLRVRHGLVGPDPRIPLKPIGAVVLAAKAMDDDVAVAVAERPHLRATGPIRQRNLDLGPPADRTPHRFATNVDPQRA